MGVISLQCAVEKEADDARKVVRGHCNWVVFCHFGHHRRRSWGETDKLGKGVRDTSDLLAGISSGVSVL